MSVRSALYRSSSDRVALLAIDADMSSRWLWQSDDCMCKGNFSDNLGIFYPPGLLICGR
jgi:hypothetical protein